MGITWVKGDASNTADEHLRYSDLNSVLCYQQLVKLDAEQGSNSQNWQIVDASCSTMTMRRLTHIWPLVENCLNLREGGGGYSSYNSDLALSYYHFFLNLQNSLNGKVFADFNLLNCHMNQLLQVKPRNSMNIGQWYYHKSGKRYSMKIVYTY